MAGLKPNKARVAAGPLSPQDLAIIAGLPRTAAAAGAAHVEALSTRWRAIGEPFNNPPGRIYADRRGLFDFMQNACAFIRDLGQTTPPRPARLVVFYVDDPSAQALFDAFGYSALFIRLDSKTWHWPRGKPWTSDIRAVRDVLTEAVDRTGAEALKALRLRLEAAATDEALLLPPRNFEQPDRSDLTARFSDLSHNETLHIEDFANLTTEVFDYDSLPKFFGKVRDISKPFRVDRRGLVFARSLSGQHGFVRLATMPGAGAATLFREPLESAFRFGTPLLDGFQHDVQWRGKARLAKQSFFDIATRTRIPISGSHANVYASDRVT
ncbi:MAG: hypothetical protein DCE92_02000 [Alphaproteobacteria bacterium]|nr:MAG: hypothetical protein DCE92_02000 [Alphaproteobacteria bacterium]